MRILIAILIVVIGVSSALFASEYWYTITGEINVPIDPNADYITIAADGITQHQYEWRPYSRELTEEGTLEIVMLQHRPGAPDFGTQPPMSAQREIYKSASVGERIVIVFDHVITGTYYPAERIITASPERFEWE